MPDEVLTKLTNASGEWEYVELDAEELAQMAVDQEAYDLNLGQTRIERTAKLAESDWTQAADVVLTAEKVAEWATYRQELRDYPAQSDRVSTLPEWPTPPE